MIKFADENYNEYMDVYTLIFDFDISQKEICDCIDYLIN